MSETKDGKSSSGKSADEIRYEQLTREVGTEIKSVSIKRVQTARSRSQVVLYQINVTPSRGNAWVKLKRFDAFAKFHAELEKELSKCGLPAFPPKFSKILTDHFDRFFIEKRREDLEKYMQALLRIDGMGNQELVLRFLGVKK